MDTTTQQHRLSILALGDSLQALRHKIFCWWRGYTPVSVEAELSAKEFMDEVVMSEVVADVQHNNRTLRGEKRSRVRKRLPFVAYLVQEMRGEHGQMSFCEANELKLQRHVRDACKEKNVRSVDIATLWPLVHAAYFFSRDETQVLAQEWKHTSSFVDSITEATREFCGSAGRSSVARSA